MAITISENKRTFLRDNQPFFYLADTCWSAFTNITDEEWLYYLNFRKQQGFTTLQINILHQWDASTTDLNYTPFEKKEDGTINFDQLNEVYFEHASQMCKIAKQQGFALALVVLWSNYVPDTWAQTLFQKDYLPFESLDAYIKKVDKTFSIYNPMYIISGDTDFPTDRTIEYYAYSAKKLRQLAPHCLQAFHIKGRLDELPQSLAEVADFYMFQSGHNAKIENLNTPISLAKSFYELEAKKPIINSEPCYEQMGYSAQMYGRFYQFDVRRAAWLSLLSGACAGVSYGAAGIYSWHKTGHYFAVDAGEGFDNPNPWNDAIHYPGAWDYGFIRHLFELYKVGELIPSTNVIKAKNEQIRCATSEDERLIFIYVPVNTSISFLRDMKKYTCKAYDLEEHRIGYPQLCKQGSSQFLDIHKFSRDVVYVMEKISDE